MLNLIPPSFCSKFFASPWTGSGYYFQVVRCSSLCSIGRNILEYVDRNNLTEFCNPQLVKFFCICQTITRHGRMDLLKHLEVFVEFNPKRASGNNVLVQLVKQEILDQLDSERLILSSCLSSIIDHLQIGLSEVKFLNYFYH